MAVTTVVTPGHIDRRQGQQGDHAGEEEQHAPATRPPRMPLRVSRCRRPAVGLRAGQEHAVVEGMQEPLGADPAALLDQLTLHDRDLAGWAAEGLQRDGEPGPDGLAEGHQVLAVAGGWTGWLRSSAMLVGLVLAPGVERRRRTSRAPAAADRWLPQPGRPRRWPTGPGRAGRCRAPQGGRRHARCGPAGPAPGRHRGRTRR